ncbi:disease resistance protein RGA2-like [Humulus lupulus]|uniref:disease resistance protein RGA2-like n=1 Tax=Humulus lupulus TaxID=3486 RepID=UPI002B417F7D|nr:disease resistance protein RGA2-like [Humulus lupulus]
MAELILSPIADKIIGRLGCEAVKQISRVWGVKDALEQLKETISTIQAVLLDAELKQSHNNQVNNWLHRLGNAVLEADDLMDEINTEALRCQLMSPNQMANRGNFYCMYSSLFKEIVLLSKWRWNYIIFTAR